MSELTCRLATADGDWLLLRNDWDRLYQLTPGITPWQSWDFLSRWWRSLRGSRRLRLVVIERAGVVQMILPLQLSVIAPVRLRVLEPVGMPDDINRPRLALGASDGRLFAAAWQLLWQHRHEWDALRVDEKLPHDAEVEWLRQFAQSDNKNGSGWLQAIAFHPCPYLQMPPSWDLYARSRSPSLLKKLRAAQRCLAARGTVTAQRFDEPDDVLRAFDTLISLHQRSWKHAAQVGLSQSDDYRRFYRQFVEVSAARRQARAWVLHCDSQPIAATFAFHEGVTYYSAQIAHDSAFSKCSPGTLLESIEMQDLLAEGRFRTYDFLGGALNNKLRWTDTAHVTQRVWFLRRSWRGALFQRYYFQVKPLIKRLRPSSPLVLRCVNGISCR